jgi:UDP-glucose-4-epimerase GalE
VFDDLSAGHRAAVEALGSAADVPLVVGDIRDTDAVRVALRDHDVSAVLHFAAWLSVGASVADPTGYYENNVVGALSLLRAMVQEEVGRLVFSSTCAVYGEPDETPIRETHPTRPVNPYGETKLAIERALPHFDRAYGLRAIRLRYFNASGADPSGLLGEDHDPEIHLLPRAILAVHGGPPLQIFGEDYPTPDGTCLRDYVHVTDLADAHVLALHALERGATGAVYNLGTGQPVSVRQVLQAVERVGGRPVPWEPAGRRPGDPAVLFAASDRAREELGWRPQLQGLDRIVETAWAWHETHPRGYQGASAT